MSQYIKSIEKILNDSHTGTMATVKNNKTHSRYMIFLTRMRQKIDPSN